MSNLDAVRFGHIVGDLDAKLALAAAAATLNPPKPVEKKEVVINWPGTMLDGCEAYLEGVNAGGVLISLKANGELKLVPQFFVTAKPAKRQLEPQVSPPEQPKTRGDAPQVEEQTETSKLNTEVETLPPTFSPTKPKNIKIDVARNAPAASDAIAEALAEAKATTAELEAIEVKVEAARAKLNPELVEQRHIKALNAIIEGIKEAGIPVVKAGEELVAIDKDVKILQVKIPEKGKAREAYDAMKADLAAARAAVAKKTKAFKELEDILFKRHGGTVSEQEAVRVFKGNLAEWLGHMRIQNERGLLKAADAKGFETLHAGLVEMFGNIIDGLKELLGFGKKALASTKSFVSEMKTLAKQEPAVTANGEMGSDDVDGCDVRVYDNGGETFDRYTIVVENPETLEQSWLGSSEDPFYPSGFGQHLGTTGEIQEGDHLGKRIPFSELPAKVQKFVKQDAEVMKSPAESGGPAAAGDPVQAGIKGTDDSNPRISTFVEANAEAAIAHLKETMAAEVGRGDGWNDDATMDVLFEFLAPLWQESFGRPDEDSEEFLIFLEDFGDAVSQIAERAKAAGLQFDTEGTPKTGGEGFVPSQFPAAKLRAFFKAAAGEPITGEGYDGTYVLVHEDTGKPVIESEVIQKDGEDVGAVDVAQAPHKPGSNGFVQVGGARYYAKVYGLKWVKMDNSELQPASLDASDMPLHSHGDESHTNTHSHKGGDQPHRHDYVTGEVVPVAGEVGERDSHLVSRPAKPGEKDSHAGRVQAGALMAAIQAYEPRVEV